MTEDTRTKLTKSSTWIRLIYILLFTLTFNVAEIVIGVITIIQFFTVLLTGGEPNRRLQEFGAMMGLYVRDVVSFLTYETEEKPFPIGDWPTPAKRKSPAGGKKKVTTANE